MVYNRTFSGAGRGGKYYNFFFHSIWIFTNVAIFAQKQNNAFCMVLIGVGYFACKRIEGVYIVLRKHHLGTILKSFAEVVIFVII